MIRVDIGALLDFENQLNPAHPEKSGIRPEILGFGEISTTFCLPFMPDVALKRMPPFPDIQAVEAYQAAVDAYCHRLKDACGINVIPYEIHALENRFGETIVYVAQPRLADRVIGNRCLRGRDQTSLETMIQTVCRKLLDVWRYNLEHGPEESLGIDGQISNWGFAGPGENPVYIDVTTPMLRIGGAEQLDAEIFLKSCPSFLVWLVRWRFLQEVLDRYHDSRLVLIDLAANLFKEGCEVEIPAVIEVINRTVSGSGAAARLAPVTLEEVRRYYRNDAFIWALFLRLRRMDRFIKTRLLGRRYNFILPGKIRR